MTAVWVVLNETGCGFSEVHGVYADASVANKVAEQWNNDDPSDEPELPRYTVHECEVQTVST